MMHELIHATRQRHKVEFDYEGEKCLVEPYTYGILDPHGEEILVGYQIAGPSEDHADSLWRRFDEKKIKNVSVLHEEIEQMRPGYDRYDIQFLKIYARF